MRSDLTTVALCARPSSTAGIQEYQQEDAVDTPAHDGVGEDCHCILDNALNSYLTHECSIRRVQKTHALCHRSAAIPNSSPTPPREKEEKEDNTTTAASAAGKGEILTNTAMILRPLHFHSPLTTYSTKVGSYTHVKDEGRDASPPR